MHTLSAIRVPFLLLALSLAATPWVYGQDGSSQRQYTFSWPMDQDGTAAPRGGTTRGPQVELATAESSAWKALQEADISNFERDRRAILAMAGDYRVTFDFIEIAPFAMGAQRDRPYQSWGTERIYVDRDTGRFISLVHILEMRFMQEDGSISEPMVTKHWRQDWQFEPRSIVEYAGHNRWRTRSLTRAERAGAWSQTVHQVDESPRYASFGRWEHTPSFSTWLSGETWRPLPSREWRVRKDYHVLVGTNRHTIAPWGWLQEENNLKTVLTAERRPDPARPHLAREYGVARYERLAAGHLSAADRYYERTRAFWNQVHSTWTGLFRRHGEITLRAPVDQAGLFQPLFAYADRLARGESVPDEAARVIENSLGDILSEAGQRTSLRGDTRQK